MREDDAECPASAAAAHDSTGRRRLQVMSGTHLDNLTRREGAQNRQDIRR